MNDRRKSSIAYMLDYVGVCRRAGRLQDARQALGLACHYARFVGPWTK